MATQFPGDRGCILTTEEGVASPCEMDLVDGFEAGEGADQSSPTFTKQGFNSMFNDEYSKEVLKRAKVDRCPQSFKRTKFVYFSGFRHKKVESSSRGPKNLVLRVKFARS